MAKLDPRADPVSVPPDGKDDFSVDRVAVPKNAKKASIRESREDEPEKLERTDNTDRTSEPMVAESSVVPVPAEKVEKATKKVTSQDPRYEPIEKLLDLNDWKKIGEELGSMDDVGKLPPNLGLVAALAHNENAKDGDPEAIATAIRCMAGLLGVADDSPIARVLARRMLRKNPVKLRDLQAPPARTSVIIVLLTLIVGGGVGWLASIGSWRGIAHVLHLQ
jgi:hypothetical protein